jgi:hypothetical protein
MISRQTVIESAKCTSIAHDRPSIGARRVFWLIKGQFGLCWKHVGWLMPEAV